MQRPLFALLLITCSFAGCKTQPTGPNTNTNRESITSLEMNLSAFGVESDSFPSIRVFINFLTDSSKGDRSYYNPAIKPSTYTLTRSEIKEILKLLESPEFEKLNSEYSVTKTDQPTSIVRIYAGHKTTSIKDYGLEGPYPLPELYKLAYKY